MLELSKPLRISRAQWDFLEATERFRAFVGGRGAGKSRIGALDLLQRAKPGRLYQVNAPDYTVLMDASFRSLVEVAGEYDFPLDVKQSLPPKGKLRLVGGDAEILFRSMDDPEKRRGPNLSGAWLDEASGMEQAAFDVQIASLREQGEMGWLTATFTPKGKLHWTYGVFGTGRPDTKLIRCRTADNPFLPPEFYETVARQYGESSWLARQELEGEFVNAEGALMKLAWFKTYGWLGAKGPAFDGLVVNATGKRYMRSDLIVLIICDPSLGGKGSDKCGIGVIALTEDLRYAIVLHAVSERIPVEEIVDRLDELARVWAVDLCLFEANGFQVTVARSARNKLPCVVREVDPKGKSKLVRGTPMIELCHTGCLLVPEEARWLPGYLDEMCSWSGLPDEQDDQVDFTAYGVLDMMQRRADCGEGEQPSAGPSMHQGNIRRF